MPDTYDLQRFVEAQDSIYAEVVRELERGYKQSHWMWFIFPQIQGLGKSGTARKFSIGSLDEAREYLKHPVLGARLRECTRLVLAVEGRTSEQIFGAIDTLKFRSSMTLFLYATEENRIFQEALEKYFEGQGDRLTIDILQKL